MSKTTQTLAALALSALAMTVTFAQGGAGGGQRGGGGAAPGGGGQGGGGARGPQQPMSFFITSVGKGDGAGVGPARSNLAVTPDTGNRDRLAASDHPPIAQLAVLA